MTELEGTTGLQRVQEYIVAARGHARLLQKPEHSVQNKTDYQQGIIDGVLGLLDGLDLVIAGKQNEDLPPRSPYDHT